MKKRGQVERAKQERRAIEQARKERALQKYEQRRSRPKNLRYDAETQTEGKSHREIGTQTEEKPQESRSNLVVATIALAVYFLLRK